MGLPVLLGLALGVFALLTAAVGAFYVVANRSRRPRDTIVIEVNRTRNRPPQQARLLLQSPTISDIYRDDTGNVDTSILVIGIIGMVKAGKSSLINSLRGLSDSDPGSAPTDSNECTTEPKAYTIGSADIGLKVVDLPGAGTVRVPLEEYFRRFALYRLGALVLVTYSALTDFDVQCIARAVRYKIPVLVVRSKSDIDLREHVLKEYRRRHRSGEPCDAKTLRCSVIPVLFQSMIASFESSFKENLQAKLEDLKRQNSIDVELVRDMEAICENSPPFFLVNRDTLLEVQRELLKQDTKMQFQSAAEAAKNIARICKDSAMTLSDRILSAVRIRSQYGIPSQSTEQDEIFTLASVAMESDLEEEEEAISKTNAASPTYPPLRDEDYKYLGQEMDFLKSLYSFVGQSHREVVPKPPVACPLNYICPITLEIMNDPVVASDGNSYDRTAIEAWLLVDNRSPLTRETLTTILYPNTDLRRQINEWKVREEHISRLSNQGYEAWSCASLLQDKKKLD